MPRVLLPSGLSPSVPEFHQVNRHPAEQGSGSRTVTAGSDFHRPRSTWCATGHRITREVRTVQPCPRRADRHSRPEVSPFAPSTSSQTSGASISTDSPKPAPLPAMPTPAPTPAGTAALSSSSEIPVTPTAPTALVGKTPGTRRKMLIPVIALVAFLLGGLVGWATDEGVTRAKAHRAAAVAAEAQSRVLSDAYQSCASPAGVTVADGGASMLIDTRGTEDSSGANLSGTACVLKALEIPDYVLSQVDATRALDGTQTATWNELSATWNYHPDHGMSMTIHLSDASASPIAGTS